MPTVLSGPMSVAGQKLTRTLGAGTSAFTFSNGHYERRSDVMELPAVILRPAKSISLLDLARVHLDGGVEQPGRKRAFHRERLLHAEIGLHQVVILLHPLGVDPTKRFRRGEVVRHQEF